MKLIGMLNPEQRMHSEMNSLSNIKCTTVH